MRDAGLEKKSWVLVLQERNRVAHHEMSHALVAASLPGVDPVHKVSIIPRGVGALGYTMQRPTEDRFLLGRHELENRIAVLRGGRAAEALVFEGEVSTGASDDLQRATQIATEMVTRSGDHAGDLGPLVPTSPSWSGRSISSKALSPRFGLSISWSGKRNFVGRDWRAISAAECGRTAGIRFADRDTPH